MTSSKSGSARIASVVLGIAVSALFLWLAFRGLSWGDLTRGAAQMSIPIFVAACLLHPLRFWFTACRWQILLRPCGRISVRSLFPIVAVSFAANNVLPLRAGEAIRVIALQRQEGVPGSVGFSTIIVERVVDLATLLGLFAVAALILPIDPTLRSTANGLATMCGAGVVCVYLLLGFRGRMAGRMNTLLERWPSAIGKRAAGMITRFVDGMAPLLSGRSVVKVLIYSFASWFVEGAIYCLVAMSFGVHLSCAQTMLLMVCAALAVLVPSSPGYVGVFEWVVAGTLVSFGVARVLALTAAVACHVALTVSITLLGLVFGLRFGYLRRRSVPPDAEAQPETDEASEARI